MCPERVCRTCGEPSHRIVSQLNEERGRLSVEIRRGRLAAGLSQRDVAAWFPSVSGGLTGCVWNWENGANVPTVEQWVVLRDRLILSDKFNELIGAESRWNDAEYVDGNGAVSPALKWESGIPKGKGAHSDKPGSLTRVAPEVFTDCGHDDWRPGVWLDPFR